MWSKTVLNIKENTLVLFKDSNDHPLKWALGRIDNIVVGKDNLVRIVDIKTQNDI